MTLSIPISANHSCVSDEKFQQLVKVIITAYKNGYIVTNDTEEDHESTWSYYNSIFFSATIVTTIGKNSDLKNI